MVDGVETRCTCRQAADVEAENTTSRKLTAANVAASRGPVAPTLLRVEPLSNRRSLSSVSRVLRMAEFALKISSMNATWAWVGWLVALGAV